LVIIIHQRVGSNPSKLRRRVTLHHTPVAKDHLATTSPKLNQPSACPLPPVPSKNHKNNNLTSVLLSAAFDFLAASAVLLPSTAFTNGDLRAFPLSPGFLKPSSSAPSAAAP